MGFLLDTNACIVILNNSSSALIERVRREQPSDIVLCAVVKAELIYGAYRSVRVAENLRTLQRFFAALRSLPFDDLCAAQYGEVRHQLERAGTLIGPNDLMIAATALAHDLILVSANVREFERVVGLRVENWQSF